NRATSSRNWRAKSSRNAERHQIGMPGEIIPESRATSVGIRTLRFFYGVTLGQAEIPERIPYAREPRKLPIVLSADEVVRFLEAVPSLKTRTALTTAYAAGLRASEAVGLKVGDIDSGRMVIRVEHGKGGKDRYVMLSPQLLRILRTYWLLARPQHWLFPGRTATQPIDVQALHAACRSAYAAAR